MKKRSAGMYLVWISRQWRSGVLCVLAAAVMFGAVNYPVLSGAVSAARQLPIYCVQRDQKLVSISFDAAWGDVRMGRAGRIPSGAPLGVRRAVRAHICPR